jgi:hypothetical protein
MAAGLLDRLQPGEDRLDLVVFFKGRLLAGGIWGGLHDQVLPQEAIPAIRHQSAAASSQSTYHGEPRGTLLYTCLLRMAVLC